MISVNKNNKYTKWDQWFDAELFSIQHINRKLVDLTPECPWQLSLFKHLSYHSFKVTVTLHSNNKNWERSMVTFKPYGTVAQNLNVQKASFCNSLCLGSKPDILFTGITSKIKNLKLLGAWCCSKKCCTKGASVTLLQILDLCSAILVRIWHALDPTYFLEQEQIIKYIPKELKQLAKKNLNLK